MDYEHISAEEYGFAARIEESDEESMDEDINRSIFDRDREFDDYLREVSFLINSINRHTWRTRIKAKLKLLNIHSEVDFLKEHAYITRRLRS